MITEFVECRWKGEAKLSKVQLERLPNRLALSATVQFLSLLPSIKKQIVHAGKKATLLRATKGCYPGQVLGCSDFKTRRIEGLLFVGDGLFHPINLKLHFEGEVFAFNPLTKKMGIIDDVIIAHHKGRAKGLFSKFLIEREVGVLISTKQGQVWKAFSKLERRYKDKRFYYFIFDEIDLRQLENFPFVKVFINTACPRIGLEDAIVQKKPVLNLSWVL